MADSGGATDVQFALSYCDVTWSISCRNLAEETVSITSTLADGFQQIVVDFGMIDHTLDSSILGRPSLVLLVVTDGSEVVHTGFDSDETPSQLKMTIIED